MTSGLCCGLAFRHLVCLFFVWQGEQSRHSKRLRAGSISAGSGRRARSASLLNVCRAFFLCIRRSFVSGCPLGPSKRESFKGEMKRGGDGGPVKQEKLMHRAESEAHLSAGVGAPFAATSAPGCSPSYSGEGVINVSDKFRAIASSFGVIFSV